MQPRRSLWACCLPGRLPATGMAPTKRRPPSDVIETGENIPLEGHASSCPRGRLLVVIAGCLVLGRTIALAADPGTSDFAMTLVCADGSTGSVTLAVDAPSEALRMPVGTATMSELALVCPPGRSVEAKIGQAQPLALTPMHFYHFKARMRRTGFASVRLIVHEEPGAEEVALLPPAEYLVSPGGEDISAFYIAPAGVTGVWFRLTFNNMTNGLAVGETGLAGLEIRDIGALVELKPPRRVTSCDRLELNTDLATLPFVPSVGAGIYRITARVTATAPTPLWWSVAGGEDRRLWWWRTSEPAYDIVVPTGTSVVQWIHRVPDRRFEHQWMRVKVTANTGRVVAEDVVLEQTYGEPAGAAGLGLGTPAWR